MPGRRLKSRAKLLTTEQACYIAGMLDADGCISRGYDKRWQVFYYGVGVSNTYLPVLRWIQEVSGVGYIKGGKINSPLGRKPCWGWGIHSINDKIDFLVQIEPFLHEKRSLAQEAIVETKKFLTRRHNYRGSKPKYDNKTRTRIRAIRSKTSLTYVQLSLITGISPRTIRRICHKVLRVAA